MMIKKTFIPLTFVLLLSSCSKDPVRYFQPNIKEGGRAMSFAVNPKNEKEVLVASETGGVFQSTDGGQKWNRLKLPTFRIQDIKYLPGNSKIIIAAAIVDYKSKCCGGIWRSIDNGETWTRPKGHLPLLATDTRYSAFSIDFEEGSKKIFMGTDYGLAVSDDSGASWKYIEPEPGKAFPANQITSVIVPAKKTIYIICEAVMYFSKDGGIKWTKYSTGPTSYLQTGEHNQLAASPFNGNHLFWALNHWGGTSWMRSIYLSTDSGKNWSVAKEMAGYIRPPFVRVAKSVSGKADQIDVYFGDGAGFWKATYTSTTTSLKIVGQWNKLTIDHADPADICFKHDNKTPYLLASDGGLHKTSDNGLTWTLTGGGIKGYNALQITEVTGQIHPSDHIDLYFGTQDNYNVASDDFGNTWPYKYCCEGFYINVLRKQMGYTNIKVTGVTCGACYNYMSDPHFKKAGVFPNPTDVSGSPALVKPGYYIIATKAATATNYTYQLTPDNGKTWKTKFSFPEKPMDLPKIVGKTSDPVIYIAVKKPGKTPDGDEILGIKCITGLHDPTGCTVSDITGFNSLGIFHTMFAWYKPFGANPSDPKHLIVPDIVDKKMKVTKDGGIIWKTDTALTNLVTNNGDYIFKIKPFTQVSNIAFDPEDKSHILIGTRQNGVIRSTDGGATWKSVYNTSVYSNISSFFFANSQTAICSSYGNGLFELKFEEENSSTKKSSTQPIYKDPIYHDANRRFSNKFENINDPLPCIRCFFIYAKKGKFNDIKLNEKKEIVSVVLSSGEIGAVNNLREEVDPEMPIEYSDRLGEFSGNELLNEIVKNNLSIKGLIVFENYLKAVITYEDELTPYHLPMPKEMGPHIVIESEKELQGTPIIKPMERILLKAIGFRSPITSFPIELFIDDKPFAADIEIDKNGIFNIPILVNLPPGPHKITIVQKVDETEISDVVMINVVAIEDRFEQEHR
ncbi:MAG: hypothetical protein JXB26_20360 [Candidatus Aminicenantes bacterium]|nr:hypothetical protein [Candidatus Aminicenantes bacterium]